MKKIICWLCLLIFCLCGCQALSPARRTVSSYIECMQQGDLEKAQTYLTTQLKSSEQTPEEVAKSSGQNKEVQALFVKYMKHIVSKQWSSYQITSVSGNHVEVTITGIDASDLAAIDTKKETAALQDALRKGKDETKAFKTFYMDSQKKVDRLKARKRHMKFTVKNKKITAMELKQ